MTDPRIKPEIFKQRIPCSDCPFRKDGAVNHGPHQSLAYASYFLTQPGATFPCHKSVPDIDPRDEWSEWQEGQVICAGGLLLARKYDVQNTIVKHAVEQGMYDPATHTDEELATVVDSVGEMVWRGISEPESH